MMHISPETNARIKELSSELVLASPVYTDTHQFAVEYEERWYEDASSFRTLITGSEESLAISVRNQDGQTILFENIDLQEDGVPMIVRPDFGDKGALEYVVAVISGEKIGRPVLRALTEYEGNALIEDLEATLFPRDINRLAP